jgi:hypothetical protein
MLAAHSGSSEPTRDPLASSRCAMETSRILGRRYGSVFGVFGNTEIATNLAIVAFSPYEYKYLFLLLKMQRWPLPHPLIRHWLPGYKSQGVMVSGQR